MGRASDSLKIFILIDRDEYISSVAWICYCLLLMPVSLLMILIIKHEKINVSSFENSEFG